MRCLIAPLDRCAELLGVELATIRKAAANVEPYLHADSTKVWSLMQLERQLRPEAFGRRRGGYIDRRRDPPLTPERHGRIAPRPCRMPRAAPLDLLDLLAQPVTSEDTSSRR